ncbi:hypothetical protein [Pedobacter cryotolerans]|uniref:Uncharacterized protein n=1 Tax=Pedobacter cryotolerans TaxID=2571270 RepID=A0A4V5NX26_9SPHI|nr:hypothetical protein [Pedobacter cryotolerans]TKB97412.1 hypothetical protein FA045_15730 [Pedobacter cryotolerans]
MKRFEILNSLPAYGPMYISITADGEPYYSEGFVVRFFKADGTNWVANFKPGWTDLVYVHEFSESNNLLIIAQGLCYIINVEETKAITIFGGGYHNIFLFSDEYVILCDDISLTIVDNYEKYWQSERISYDGIKDVSFEENIVSGLAFDPTDNDNEWKEFTYNIETKILNGGSYPFEKPKKISWWKT